MLFQRSIKLGPFIASDRLWMVDKVESLVRSQIRVLKLMENITKIFF